MDSLNGVQVANHPVEEPINNIEDVQKTNSLHKRHKTKEKRKTSLSPLRNNKTSKNRTSKRKSSMAQTKKEISEAGQSIKTCDSQPNDNDDKSYNATLNLMHMKLNEETTVQHPTKVEIPDTFEDKQAENGLKTIDEVPDKEELDASKEIKQRNMILEEKLNKYDELNVDGILNVSSLNVTDNDVPLIIQRAFKNEKKKCVQLILRDNTLTSKGVKILVDQLLPIPNNLKSLYLSGNPDIGDVGIEHLSRLLQTNRSITILALHCTGITNQGVRILSNILCHDKMGSTACLEKLYISFNKLITDESLETLIQILEQNQTLKLFSLQNCSLSDNARRRLRKVTTKKKSKKFNLSE
ncbi:unnamed protein product [Adineta steineri]|uniref:Uncharacterized protein n=1 Tax=Adineta steineri TaxID=433720 RepID=A0A819BSV7_9BILA|nr:unnamed protein product [Adineta steineri]